MSEPQRWIAYFSDYRDLSQGILLDKKSEHGCVLGSASEFTAINVMHYDALRDDYAKLQAENSALKSLVREVMSAKALEVRSHPRRGEISVGANLEWTQKAKALIGGDDV